MAYGFFRGGFFGNRPGGPTNKQIAYETMIFVAIAIPVIRYLGLVGPKPKINPPELPRPRGTNTYRPDWRILPSL
jgi:hypothetical protein